MLNFAAARPITSPPAAVLLNPDHNLPTIGTSSPPPDYIACFAGWHYYAPSEISRLQAQVEGLNLIGARAYGYGLLACDTSLAVYTEYGDELHGKVVWLISDKGEMVERGNCGWAFRLEQLRYALLLRRDGL